MQGEVGDETLILTIMDAAVRNPRPSVISSMPLARFRLIVYARIYSTPWPDAPTPRSWNYSTRL